MHRERTKPPHGSAFAKDAPWFDPAAPVTGPAARGTLCLVSHASHHSRWAPLAGALAALVVVGCTDSADPRVADEMIESQRLARVHVVVEPSGDQFGVSARFAFVRGLPEEFARARIDMPVFAPDLLGINQCAPEGALTGDDGELELVDIDRSRELLLVDAGELTMELGDEQVALPLSLVPDLLPYMSGVEYLYDGEMLPQADAPVRLQADGSDPNGIPAFEAQSRLPPALGLRSGGTATTPAGDDALVLYWDPVDAAETITLRLTGLLEGSDLGEPVLCVLEDLGQSRIDLGYLRGLGLAEEADGLRVEASRLHVQGFDAGDFVGSELVLERRDRVDVTLP